MAWLFRILIMTCCVIYIGDRGYFYYGEYNKFQQAKVSQKIDEMRSYCYLLAQRKSAAVIDEVLDNEIKDCRNKGYL